MADRRLRPPPFLWRGQVPLAEEAVSLQWADDLLCVAYAYRYAIVDTSSSEELWSVPGLAQPVRVAMPLVTVPMGVGCVGCVGCGWVCGVYVARGG